MAIVAVAATPDVFAPYGKVFKVPQGTPTAQAREYTFWSDVISYTINGDTEIGWCTVVRDGEAVIGGVERHLRTPELLIPVDGPFILPVLREGADASRLEAFRVEVGEAVVISEAVWHGACIPAQGSTSSYFVIFRKGTPQQDVEKKVIEPVTVRP